MLNLIKIVFTLLIIFQFSIVFGQTTGKIRGKILDEYEQPLVGVQIIIKNLTMGTVSDSEGIYILMGLTPGEYQIHYEYIGYKTIVLNQVDVSVNRTTEVDIIMTIQPLEFNEVEFTVFKHSRKKDQTGSVRNINEKLIGQLPATELSDILQSQAGIVKGHFRGGRDTDVSYLIDGIPVNNNFSGNVQLMELPTEIIKDIEVITGTFNAEYGKALSGIVNTVTQDRYMSYGFNIKSRLNTFYSNHNNVFIGIDKIKVLDDYDLSFNIKGPIFKNYLSGIINVQTQNHMGFLNGINRFLPTDYSDFNHTDIAPSDSPWNTFINNDIYYSEHNGDNSFISMEWLKSKKYFGKIAIHPYQHWRLNISSNYESTQYQNYEHLFKYKPLGRSVNYLQSMLNSVRFTHLVSSKLTHELIFSSMDSWNASYLFENPLDSNYINERYLSYAGGFISGGMDKIHDEQWLRNRTISWKLSTQLNNQHALKLGFDYVQHEIENNPINLINIDENDPDLFSFPYDSLAHEFIFGIVEMDLLVDSLDFSDNYKKQPKEISVFIQDKMEFEQMVINLGVRYDYFNSNSVYPTQMRNPGNQLFYPLYDDYGIPLEDELGNIIADTSRMSIYPNALYQYQISPRFGLSYSVGEYAVMHFSYGHFFQVPPFYALYQNYRFRIPVQDYKTILGNPNIKAEKTVQYELGYWQQLNSNFDGEIIIYYRDIYDLLSAEVLTTYNNIKYGHFTNKDYGNVKGLEISLFYNYYEMSITGNYTLQYTRGNADNPTSSFMRLSSGEEPLPKLVPMAWDQRHTFNIIINWAKDNFSFNSVAQFNSGLPYTMEPLSESPLSNQFIYPNNAHGPSSFIVNSKLGYSIPHGNHKIKLSLIINNLFDTLIEERVYSTTGRASSYHISESTQNSFISNYNDINDKYDDPSMFGPPREIKFIIEWKI